MTIQELVARFNNGETVSARENTIIWQCGQCGNYFVTRKEAEDCEWLCLNDPE